MKQLRILVCGSRTWPEDAVILTAVLDGIRANTEKEIVIIEGEAPGADTGAKIWAETSGAECLSFPADWDRYGKSAGFRRNTQMLNEGKPDMVIAFVDKPLAESRGTAMMVDIARKASVPVYIVEHRFAPPTPTTQPEGI